MNLLIKLKKLLSRREKKITSLLFLASIFVSFLETFSISLIMLFASVATNFQKINTNKYYSYLYNFFGCSSHVNFVVLLGICLITFYFFRGGIISLFSYAQNRFAQGRFRNFAFKFFQNYLNFQYKDFASNHSTRINRVIMGDAAEVTAIVAALMIIFSECLTMLFIYSMLVWVNWKMTILLTILLGVKILFLARAFSKKLESAGQRRRVLTIKLGKVFSEVFWNFKLIKLFSNEKPILRRFDETSSGLVKENILNAVLQNTPRIILETLGFSILISIIVYVVYMHNDATRVIPVITMYAFAFYRFLPSVNKMLASYNRIKFNKNALDAIHDFLGYDLEDLGEQKIAFKDKIDLKNLSFEYDEKNKIFESVDLCIEKGKRTAFVGETGAGKSTLSDIIMGLYKPQSGLIFIDDEKLTVKNIKDWRKKIGYVPQHIYLFDGTVGQNVVFGREYDEQALVKVLKQANIYDFLMSQDGIHSKVGEGGVKLSGGQKQRIAIARALYSNPEVLVLDEATSSLDHVTESKIMDEVYNLDRSKTLIVVAHRLSTVERCDTIYKVEKGNIVLVEDLYALYNQPKKQSESIV